MIHQLITKIRPYIYLEQIIVASKLEAPNQGWRMKSP